MADDIAAVIADTRPADADPQIIDLVEPYQSQGKLATLDLSTPLPEIFQFLKRYFE